MSLLLELLILSVFSSPDMELVALPFREKGECTNEWFRVQNNGLRKKISSQGELYRFVLLHTASVPIYKTLL